MAIEDIFDGEVLKVWKDGEIVYLSFPWVTIHVFEKNFFEDLLPDLINLLNVFETEEDGEEYEYPGED